MQSPYRQSADPESLPYPALDDIACVPPNIAMLLVLVSAFADCSFSFAFFAGYVGPAVDLVPSRNWCRSCLAGRHLVYLTLSVFNLSTNQIRIAPAKPLGVGDANRSLSIAATSALTASPVSSEAVFNISQKSGSRLIEV